jgi:1-acyl-sn-glycerol-3-phosphate acyltransferase
MPLMAGQRPSSSRRKAPKLVAVPSPNGDTTTKRGGRRTDPDTDVDPAAAEARSRGRGADDHDQSDDQSDNLSDNRADDRAGYRADTDPRLESLASGLDDPRLSDVDEWGRSEHLRQVMARFFDPIYERWFRVEWEGFDKIPAEGGALIVANHAGAIPTDAPSIMHGIERDLGRPVYGLADEVFKRVPVINLGWSRLGGVQAHPDNAYRLLREQQQLVMVFPEGSKGPGKTYAERYQLRRFGRGGFVQIAMRAGVPIIPLAVIGSEETMPIVFKLPTLAKLLGVPYVPVTANMLALGPLGLLVPFPAKLRIRVLDPVHLDVLPDQPRYSRSRIMDTSEGIRHTIQGALHDMVRSRRSVWSG